VDALLADADSQPRVAVLERLLTCVDRENARLELWLRLFEAAVDAGGLSAVAERCVICHRPAAATGALSGELGAMCAQPVNRGRGCSPGVTGDARLLARATLQGAAERLFLSDEQQRSYDRCSTISSVGTSGRGESYRFLSEQFKVGTLNGSQRSHVRRPVMLLTGLAFESARAVCPKKNRASRSTIESRAMPSPRYPANRLH
jgi:hypothetical protein